MTFSYGDRVVVKRIPSKYQAKYSDIVGAAGTVRGNYGTSIAVKLDEYNNHASGNGYFYFSVSSLTLKEDEILEVSEPGRLEFESDDELRLYCTYDTLNETAILKTFAEMKKEMEENTMPTNLKYDVPMLPNYTVVGVKYPTTLSKEYAFASYEDDLSIGDTVVVRNSNGGLALVEVASIGLLDKSKVLNGCEVVCKVDLHASENRYAKAKEIADLKREMDEKVAQLQAVALYEMMAEKDPSLKILLEQFKELTK